jgi:replicative DNA helicase
MLDQLNSLEAEQAVLGSIIHDPHCADLVAQLHASDFSAPEHCEMFAWIEKDVQAGRKPTALSLCVTLGRMKVGEINGAQYIGRLASVADRARAREHLALIKELAARRLLIGIAQALHGEALNPGAAPRDTSIEAIRAINDAIATERRFVSRPKTIYEAVTDLVAGLDGPDDGGMISTGLSSLDDFMGGWPRRELSIIAGRPSMGKSALLSAIARRGAKRGGNYLIFSLEMPTNAIAARMLSDFCYASNADMRIPYSDILNKRHGLTRAQKQRLDAAREPFKASQITIHDQRGLSMPEIGLRIMRHADSLDKQGKRLDVVMIDHIGKIASGDRYRGNKVHETGEKSNALMNLAFDGDVAMVAAHQLNRNTEGREEKRPEPGDLRDTGDLEQDAHTLVFPYRPVYYLERKKLDDPEKDRIRQAAVEKSKNIMEIIVAKCRNGACGTVEAFVDMHSNHVEDLRRENRARVA